MFAPNPNKDILLPDAHPKVWTIVGQLGRASMGWEGVRWFCELAAKHRVPLLAYVEKMPVVGMENEPVSEAFLFSGTVRGLGWEKQPVVDGWEVLTAFVHPGTGRVFFPRCPLFPEEDRQRLEGVINPRTGQPLDLFLRDPANGRHIYQCAPLRLRIEKLALADLARKEGWPADLLDAPPPGVKLPAGVEWPDVAALTDDGAPRELVAALQLWAQLRRRTGRRLPFNPPENPRGNGPHWVGDLVPQFLPNASNKARERIAKVVNPRPDGGATPTADN